MDPVLRQLQGYGLDIRPEDVVRLSPLGFQHMNMLGRYSFDLPESLSLYPYALAPSRCAGILDWRCQVEERDSSEKHGEREHPR